MKYAISLLALFFSLSTFAQEVEMADSMRADGKIYVVVGVILIIFAGLVVYLARLDRKMTKLEKGDRK